MSETELPGTPALVLSPEMRVIGAAGTARGVRRAAGCLERTESAAATARAEIRRFLTLASVGPQDLFDLLLAAGEAISNGIRYGHGDEIGWKAATTRESVEIIIKYSTEPFSPVPLDGAPDAWREGGRGILLMQAIMDQARFQFSHGSVEVILTRRRTP